MGWLLGIMMQASRPLPMEMKDSDSDSRRRPQSEIDLFTSISPLHLLLWQHRITLPSKFSRQRKLRQPVGVYE